MPLSNQSSGLLYGLSSYLLWGVFPIFFHAIDHIPPLETLSHRLVWSCLLVGLLLIVTGNAKKLRIALSVPGAWKSYLLSGLLISGNWLGFIWAVTQGDILACSLGYFITPLVSVLLASVFLKEGLQRFQLIACVLAAVAVGWQIYSHDKLPIISLILACTFGLYGLVRKQQQADSITGLFLETAFIMPIALAYLVIIAITGQGYFGYGGTYSTAMLMLSGVVTAVPLLLFAAGAKRLPLSIIGFLLYINPTIQFMIAVFMFDEPFDENTMITFLLIWTALALFSWGTWKKHQQTAALERAALVTEQH